MKSAATTQREFASKIEELDRLLNDPDLPIMADRVWDLADELAREPGEASKAD
jgi:hypothetical protein